MTVAVKQLNNESLRNAEDSKARTPNQLALRRFRQNRLALLGLSVVFLFVVVFFTADLLAPFGPDAGVAEGETINLPAGSPAVVLDSTKTHILGTDNLGRDTFSRLLFGSRVSLSVGFVAESVILLIGIPLGLAAGFFGGVVDQLVMRFGEIMNSFPDLLFLIILTNVFGQRSVWLVFIALGLTSWVTMSRLVRGQVLQVKQMDYVTGARSIGARTPGIMARHILPNIMGPIIVLVTIGIPGAILSEATLTFLGVGVDPSTVTWGTMVENARPSIQSNPGQVMFPALAIATLALAMTFVGDGVRDAFDPKSK